MYSETDSAKLYIRVTKYSIKEKKLFSPINSITTVYNWFIIYF